MERVDKLRVSGISQQELLAMKKEYDEKLKYLLKDQEIKLRVEMESKLFEKDVELKKMIA
jgi:hypothetical protein